MIFRRFMMLPKFCFSEAVQSVDGTFALTQATSLLPSPIRLRVDTQVLSSAQLLAVVLCRPWLMI